MDEEGLRLDIADAIGKATAAICLQTAIVATLVTRRVITHEDAADLSGIANDALAEIDGLPDDARLLAGSCLRGCALAWTKYVTKQ